MSLLHPEQREGVCVAWLDRPGERVNTLDREALGELAALLDRVEADADTAGLVLISRKRDGFVVGADLREFDRLQDREEVLALLREGHALLERLERFPKPVVAAVHGACLGGGLELALACRYRLASEHPSTKFGLPEVELGLLPGLGGTQRLPRTVGLRQGLEMALTGRNVYARPARRLGLADATVHPPGLLPAALRATRELARGERRPGARPDGPLGWALERTPARRLVFTRAARLAAERGGGHYPAPEAILEAVRAGAERGMQAGLAAEAEGFARLLFTPESKALRHLFFARAAARRNEARDLAREVHTVAVLGAGLMGAGIAEVSAASGYDVLLKDVDPTRAAAGKRAVHRGVSARVGKGRSAFERDRIVERVVPVASDERLRRADLTIEAVLEELELKRTVLRDVERVTSEGHVFATNTSALPVGRIAEAGARPEAVLGMHYFSPVPKMPLLEVVRHEGTADWAVATAVEVGLRQGKVPIVVTDRPGFYVNRILTPYVAEALRLLREGADVRAVDDAMTAYGFPVGPLKLLDETGFDVGAKVLETLRPLFAERGVELAGIDPAALQAGLLGRKSGRGFYRYDGRRREVNDDIYRYVTDGRREGGGARRTIARREIQERLVLAMLNEAAHALQEGVLRGPADGDVGAVFGIGFPPFRGGPFWTMDRLGAAEVVAGLERLREGHGERFAPAAALRERAERGSSFH